MTPLALLSRLIAVPPVLDAVARDAHTPPGVRLAQRHTVHDAPPAGIADAEATLPITTTAQPSAPLTHSGVPVRTHPPVTALAGKTDEPGDPHSAAAPVTTRLSQTAQLLSTLLAHTLPQSHVQVPPAAMPLLPAPPHASTELAQALHTALTRSGLFYESHLADWSLGHDRLDGLMKEPQNRLPATGRDPLVTSTPLAHNDPASLLIPIARPTTPAEVNASTAMPPALHSLVSSQLQLLDTPTVLWRGDLWPGQPLDWSLQHHPLDDDPTHPHADADAPVWTSRLKLTLPRLGEIDLSLRWNQAGQLQVAIAASNPLAEHALQAARPQAHSRLTQAGCAVTAIKVSHEPR